MGKKTRLFLSLTVATLVAYCIWDYPYARLVILLATLLYGGILTKNRMAWLFIIPALLPVSDLTLYSGRLFLSEFDILLMATFAILLYPKQSSDTVQTKALRTRLPELALGLMALSYIISCAMNLSYPTGLDASNFTSYQNPLNGLRVAKGFFWALVFWPFLRSQYEYSPEKTKNYFISGILTGLFLAGIGILWERGVIDGLVHGNSVSQIIRNLLDFSTTYRVTGLFSGMHVGGTAIDGYLIMVIPFCVYAFLSYKPTVHQMLALVCLMLGCYAIMVTFSRGLYSGFMAVILFIAVVLSYQHMTLEQFKSKKVSGLIASYILATLYMAMLFSYGGYGAAVGATFLILATACSMPFLRKLPESLSLIALGAVFLIGTYVVFDSVSESKWSQNSIAFSAMLAVATGIIFTAVAYVLSSSLLPEAYSLNSEIKKATIFSLITCIFWLGIIPPLLNARMAARFSTLDEDLSHRLEKWHHTISFREKGNLNTVFGTGVGSFPKYYFFNNYDHELLVHYRYGQEKGVNYLSIGSGDFNMAQKIPGFQPHQNYLLRAKTRAREGKYSLLLRICPKHIIYSERYTPNCMTKTIRGSRDKRRDNQWQQLEFPFNSGNIGQSGIFNWPATLLINNGFENTFADITDIQLLDEQGNNLISNGNFAAKSDRWLMIRDFSHDAWHAKNIFVHVLFEQGFFGLFAFLFLLFVALTTQIRAMRHKDPLAPILIAAIGGTLIVGLFGTIIDNPRVATLYFLLIFFGLLNTPQALKQNKNTN